MCKHSVVKIAKWRKSGNIAAMITIFGCLLEMLLLISCNHLREKRPKTDSGDTVSCHNNMPRRYAAKTSVLLFGDTLAPGGKIPHEGMVWIPAGDFNMGSSDQEGRADEYPVHRVRMDGFWMDIHEVTNNEFAKFVEATRYVTTAEKAPDWDELRKQLPQGTPKPPDSVLVAASLVFTPPAYPVPLDNAAAWWSWVKGADWKHPEGPGSSIRKRGQYPVTQVSWYDAAAYAHWAHKELPTESQWEYAARGGLKDMPYSWGIQPVDQGKPKANTWQGRFPAENTLWDGYNGTAPVQSFPPNGYGLFDMAGNVWEWCHDWYRTDYYKAISGQVANDPTGPTSSYDEQEPTTPKKVIRGGSFMCNASYCKGYRVSSRMKSSPDSGLENVGFRCVSTK